MHESVIVGANSRKHWDNYSKNDKHQDPVACSFGNKLVCVNENFSEVVKKCLGKGSVYKFSDFIIEEVKYCIEIIKQKFSKKLDISE